MKNKNHIFIMCLCLGISTTMLLSFVGCQAKSRTATLTAEQAGDTSTIADTLSDVSSDASSDVSSTISSVVSSETNTSSTTSSKVTSTVTSSGTSVSSSTSTATVSSKDISAELTKEDTRHKTEIDKINTRHSAEITQATQHLNEAQTIYNQQKDVKTSDGSENMKLQQANQDILIYNAQLTAYNKAKTGELNNENSLYQTNVTKIKNQ